MNSTNPLTPANYANDSTYTSLSPAGVFTTGGRRQKRRTNGKRKSMRKSKRGGNATAHPMKMGGNAMTHPMKMGGKRHKHTEKRGRK